MKNKTFGSGWTLIELLMVIAIISILSALLMPAVNAARGQARGIACVNNLRQLSLGFELYTQAYGELLPHEDRGSNSAPSGSCWFDVLDTYLDCDNNSPVKQCPDFRGDITLYRSYKVNGRLDDNQGTNVTFPHIGRIREPQRTVLLFDARTDKFPYDTAFNWPTTTGLSGRHNNGDYILFIDGHTHRYPTEDLQNWGINNSDAPVWWGE